MKTVALSDAPGENYHPALYFPSALAEDLGLAFTITLTRCSRRLQCIQLKKKI